MEYKENINTIKLAFINTEDIVNRLNPIYIGFLLNLYKPILIKVVFSFGNPKRVDLPKLIRLNIVKNKPIDKVRYEI